MARVKDLQSFTTENDGNTARCTDIIVGEYELETSHPHCKIPPYFFEAALARQEQNRAPRKVLTIDTWDGRSVMSVEGHGKGR